ncbi:unnamed protein product, partial [Ilex paraguariensis]
MEIPRAENSHVNSLARLASSFHGDLPQMIPVELLLAPSIKDETLPSEKVEASSKGKQ